MVLAHPCCPGVDHGGLDSQAWRPLGRWTIVGNRSKLVLDERLAADLIRPAHEGDPVRRMVAPAPDQPDPGEGRLVHRRAPVTTDGRGGDPDRPVLDRPAVAVRP